MEQKSGDWVSFKVAIYEQLYHIENIISWVKHSTE